ncbi:hypothetical protein D3C80_1490810 [compost metagenome]
MLQRISFTMPYIKCKLHLAGNYIGRARRRFQLPAGGYQRITRSRSRLLHCQKHLRSTCKRIASQSHRGCASMVRTAGNLYTIPPLSDDRLNDPDLQRCLLQHNALLDMQFNKCANILSERSSPSRIVSDGCSPALFRPAPQSAALHC